MAAAASICRSGGGTFAGVQYGAFKERHVDLALQLAATSTLPESLSEGKTALLRAFALAQLVQTTKRTVESNGKEDRCQRACCH